MNEQNKKIEQEFLSLLRSESFPLNESLERIIHFFFSTENHLTIEDIKSFAEEKKISVTTDNIQKTLDLLEEYGFAKKRSFQDGIPRYEHLHLDEHHDHFICTRCGKIEEFSSPDLETRQTGIAAEFGFRPFWHKMEIYGLCRNCCPKDASVTLPLSMIQAGGRIAVIRIEKNLCGGRHDRKEGFPGWFSRLRNHHHKHHMERRIVDMGLTVGTRAEVLSNRFGMVVLVVKGTRIAVGRQISQRVMVKIEN